MTTPEQSKTSLQHPRVLLIFGNTRGGLAITRSLAKIGCEVHHVRIDHFKGAIDYSNTIKTSFFLGNVFSEFYDVLCQLNEIVNDFDVVVPVNDAAYELCFRLRKIVKGSQFESLPEESSYRLVSDKFLIHRVFADLFKTSDLRLNNMFLNENSRFQSKFNFPLYSKPRFSTAIIGRCLRSFGVKRIENESALSRHVRDSWPIQCIHEHVIKGESIGINVVAYKGQLLGIGCTRRLHQPRDGGGSSYRISDEVSDRYISIASEIVARVQWTGYMMIECIRNGEDIFLIEINPRPWGSLPLTIFSGVDMPKILFNSLSGTNSLVVSSPGYRARNFLKDLKWLMWNPSRFLSWLFSFNYILRGKERLDVERLDDFMPTIAQLAAPFNNIYERLINKYLFAKPDNGYDPSRPVIFVCKGNINRSAVSEILAKERWDVSANSYGFICKPGRKISENAESFLKKKLLDGSQHLSKFIDHDLTDSKQIVVFERSHIRRVRKVFPGRKVFLLSKIAKQKTFDIKDPEFMHSQDAEKIFEEIDDCLRCIYG